MEIKVNIIPDAVDEEGRPIFSSIEDAIIASMRSRIEALAEKVATRLAESAVKTSLDDYVGTRVKNVVDDLLSKPIVKTSPYGEKKGEPTTLTELVVEAIN